MQYHCRRAASASVSRDPEELADYGPFEANVAAAQAIASFAGRTGKQEHGIFFSSEVPDFVAHLSAPATPTPREDTPDVASQEVQLPGTVGAFGDGSARPWRAPVARQDIPPPLLDPPQLEVGDDLREQSSRELDGDLLDAEETEWGSIVHRSSGSGGLHGSSESSASWLPKPPLTRFKNLLKFSRINEDLEQMVVDTKREMHDMTIGWLNSAFQMAIVTEFQFETGFPVIILTILDAIYRKHVCWRQVDWRLAYKIALVKNYAALNQVWTQVNMEMVREFRPEYTNLRIEDMPTCDVRHKLEFLRLIRRWFEVRILYVEPFDVIQRRLELVERSRLWGHKLEFPSWIRLENDAPRTSRGALAGSKALAYSRRPEYQRLTSFLGSNAYQTM